MKNIKKMMEKKKKELNIDDILSSAEKASNKMTLSEEEKKETKSALELLRGKKDDDILVDTENLTEILFRNILKFDDDKIEKLGKVLKAASNAMALDVTIPDGDMKILIESAKSVFDWFDAVPDLETVNPMKLIKAKKKLTELRRKLGKHSAYYGALEGGFTVNRRSTRAAVSVGIRQFSKGMEENVKSMLTLGDAENFGEVITSSLHGGELSCFYLHSLLKSLDRSINDYMQVMTDVVNFYKFEMKQQ